MVVDFHTHIFKNDVIESREKYFGDKNYYFLYSGEKARMINHNMMLDSMNDSGIDFAVAMGFPWYEEKHCDEQNEYFNDVYDLSKGRIIPFGSVPIRNGIDIDRYVKGIKESGLFGIGEIAFYKEGMNQRNNNILRQIFDSAQRYFLPVCLHVNEPVGHEYMGKYEPSLKILYSILLDFPDLTIILAHWGGGLFLYELMPEVQEAFKNVYYDTAASPFLYSDEIYDIVIRIVGSKKILFGSDYPLIKFKRYLNSINTCVKDIEDRENIIHKNAKDILNI